jgi:hypothetical protein
LLGGDDGVGGKDIVGIPSDLPYCWDLEEVRVPEHQFSGEPEEVFFAGGSVADLVVTGQQHCFT